jgi:hypothetical protein
MLVSSLCTTFTSCAFFILLYLCLFAIVFPILLFANLASLNFSFKHSCNWYAAFSSLATMLIQGLSMLRILLIAFLSLLACSLACITHLPHMFCFISLLVACFLHQRTEKSALCTFPKLQNFRLRLLLGFPVYLQI